MAELFDDLEVKFDFSETFIEGLDGRFKPGVYKGEEAYKFLAALLRADKTSFEAGYTEVCGYYKTILSIKYKDVDIGNIRIDLADMELGDKTSVADALKCRFSEYFSKDVLGEFKSQEEKYLSYHPDWQKFNEYKVDSYWYIVEKRFMDYLNKLPGNGKEFDFYFLPNVLEERPINFGVENYIASPSLDDLWNTGHFSGRVMNRYSGSELKEALDKGNKSEYVMIKSTMTPFLLSEAMEDPNKPLNKMDFKIGQLYTDAEFKTYQLINSLEYRKVLIPTNPYTDRKADAEYFVSGYAALTDAIDDYYSSNYEIDRLVKTDGPLYNNSFKINGLEKTGFTVDDSDNKGFFATFAAEENVQLLKNMARLAGKYFEDAYSDKHFRHVVCGRYPVNEEPELSQDEKINKLREQFRVVEKLQKGKISDYDLENLSWYYRLVGNIRLGHEKMDLKDSDRVVVKEMIKDGLKATQIKSLFKWVHSKVAPLDEQKDSVVSEILQESEIKKLRKECQKMQSDKAQVL